MSNSLGRDLVKDEIVVVHADGLKPEYAPVERRLFRVSGGGFGAKHGTSGSAVYGTWIDDGIDDRIEGRDIDKAETEEYQAGHLGACILTDAPGEDSDDCHTHEHEPAEA